MANAIRFPQATTAYKAPGCVDLWTKDERIELQELKRSVNALSEIPEVMAEQKNIVSCWQLTPDELDELQRNGGKVYLHLVGMQPPCFVTSFDPSQLNLFESEVGKPGPIDPKNN